MDRDSLTERQRAWFATLQAGLERDTGRTLEQWAQIGRACPEVKPRARLAWMKAEHGLAQNRASIVLNAAFPPDGVKAPDAERAALWSSEGARAILAAVEAMILALPDVLVGQRKSFTAFSRRVQFAAARPAGDALILGLAVEPEEHPLLRPVGRASWSERLKAEARLASADEAAPLAEVVRRAWSLS